MPEDRELVDDRVADWAEELGAVGSLERMLVAEAASASVRMHRADLTEAARAEARAAEVQARRLAKARAQVADAAAKLRGWTAAADLLAAQGTVVPAHGDAFAALLGVPAVAPGGAIDRRLRALIDLANRLAFRKLADEDRDATRRALLERLEAHRDDAAAWAEACRAALDVAEAAPKADGWVDPSPKGELLRRYRGAAARDFHRALTRLERLRRMPDSPLATADDDEERNEPRSPEAAATCAVEPAPDGGAEPSPPAGPTPTEGGPTGPATPIEAPRNEPRSRELTTTYADRAAASGRDERPGDRPRSWRAEPGDAPSASGGPR